MRSLAPGRLHEAIEIERGEALANPGRRRRHLRPGHAGAGVQVEHDAVGALQVVSTGVPRVELQRVHLHESEHPVQRVGDEVVGALGLLLDGDPAQRARRPGPGMLHEEALPLRALGTSDERQRAILEVRQHRGCDPLVVEGHVLLGLARAREHHALRMGEAHAGHVGRTLLALRRDGLASLPRHFAARRFSAGLKLGPFGTAQLFNTPSSSRRKS